MVFFIKYRKNISCPMSLTNVVVYQLHTKTQTNKRLNFFVFLFFRVNLRNCWTVFMEFTLEDKECKVVVRHIGLLLYEIRIYTRITTLICIWNKHFVIKYLVQVDEAAHVPMVINMAVWFLSFYLSLTP